MALPPYSVRFLEVAGYDGSFTASFHVDPPYIGVIKCITFVHGHYTIATPVGGWVEFAADHCKLARFFHPANAESASFGGTDLFYGSWVLESSADVVQLGNEAGAFDCVISGYKLLAA